VSSWSFAARLRPEECVCYKADTERKKSTATIGCATKKKRLAGGEAQY